MQTQNRKAIRSAKVVGLIPARWQSSRFEGKPLQPINGIPMIQRVYNQCTLVESLEKVIVLTDDDRIQEFCITNSMACLRIDDHCETGTDRCAKAIEFIEADFFVNIQGDEPVIDPNSIDSLVRNFLKKNNDLNVFSKSKIRIGNAFTEIKDDKKLNDKNIVKVVFDKKRNALFFSRHPLPHPKGTVERYFQQLGLYIYSKRALKTFSELTRLPLEKSEEIELLRFLEHGYSVEMIKVKDIGLSVDVPEDIKFVEDYLNNLKNN
tara:strand:+ start:4032 stop:4823 length:792 start_codon:yes stop_codon:yes gene_type:complete